MEYATQLIFMVSLIFIICFCISKANSKYMKDYSKYKELSMYWEANNLYRQTLSEKPCVNKFEWEENTSKLIEKFFEKLWKY